MYSNDVTGTILYSSIKDSDKAVTLNIIENNDSIIMLF